MSHRINYARVCTEGYRAILRLKQYADDSGLARELLELVRMRASQINGCAYCLSAHGKRARAGGEREERLYLLDAWRNSTLYDDRERAALAWTEALTRLPSNEIADALRESVRRHFSEKEFVDLTMAVVSINALNRMAIPFSS